LVDCYIWASQNKDSEELADDPRYVEDILLSIKDFAEENPSVFTAFIAKHKIKL